LHCEIVERLRTEGGMAPQTLGFYLRNVWQVAGDDVEIGLQGQFCGNETAAATRRL
jgi:hypothetical protein